MPYEPVIGLEIHAELLTRSKMFCACPVVDTTRAQPNSAVCPVCAGMPGALPVINRQAVEYGLRAAAALGCAIVRSSLFARKNYFYPDLPKGYQISQYEYPLALGGQVTIDTPAGEKRVRIRRVHLEEDTGKLSHVTRNGESFSLVDLNRAGVALLEIVSEPDLRSPEEARSYAGEIRAVLRALGVNSGDMEKGVIRFEANVSLRPAGTEELGTRVEIKNLNSFRALERACAYEIQRQSALLERGEPVVQQTLGWDDLNGMTFSQRSKEEAHDYRYFPEPDLPPLVVDEVWEAAVRFGLPELPRARAQRLAQAHGIGLADARRLAEDEALAAYFEAALRSAPQVPPRAIVHWITGELFAWMNTSGETLEQLRVSPQGLAELARLTAGGEVNLTTAHAVLGEMLASGRPAGEIIRAGGRQQISDHVRIAALVAQVLDEHPQELASYLGGKETLANWFFGQVMRRMRGQANPQLVQVELERELAQRRLPADFADGRR